MDRISRRMWRRANQKDQEEAGNVADSTDVRMALMQRLHAGEISLEDAQAELKKIKRNAKRNGKLTLKQARNTPVSGD